MGLFKDVLGAEESLFKNEIALDFDFVPKLLPYRENQQKVIASCIKPLLLDKNGKNVFVYGAPGIGKTAAIRWVLRDLEEETDDVLPLYINCWQKNTPYKILVELCGILGYRFVQNKNTDELFNIVKTILNKKPVVIAFDEVDKVEDIDFIYSFLEDIYKKTIILITNYKEWLGNVDERIMSRLTPEMLEFRQYNAEETRGILKQRIGYAFVSGVWDEEAFNIIADKTAQLKDIRSGLHLLREAGNYAESDASKKINTDHAKKAVEKLNEFTIKKSSDLEEETKSVLDIVKENSGRRIGELHKLFQEKGGGMAYKTFQRKIEKLQKNGFVSVKKITGGKEGNTTIVNYKQDKKLTDF